MGPQNTQTAKVGSWRSSTWLVIFTATLGLFTENFLYGFIVPIVAYMFEVRLGQDPKYTQRYTSSLLFILGFLSVPCAPLIGHLADKTSNRKIPLLISLAGCALGTWLVAATFSVWSVFLGRVFQGVAGTGAWIVSFAMLTDSIDKKHFGKTLGFASSFITGGILTGPAVAGALLEWLGYWPAWSVPFALLVIDLVARLVMTKPEKAKELESESTHSADRHQEERDDEGESSPLLDSVAQATNEDRETEAKPDLQTPQNFYLVMIRKGSVIAALLNTITLSLIFSAFDATFPLHLRAVFDWGPAPIGLIFLGLQIPGMILAPLVGWLRDRVGLRWPVAIGWALEAPLIWFAGVPGSWELPGLRTKSQSQAAFVAAIISFGLVAPLIRGAGSFQLTLTLRETQDKNPGIFGPQGGSSRLFAMIEVAFNGGLMLGPVVGGALADTVGFYYMMLVLTALSIIVAIVSGIFMTHKSSARTPDPESDD